MVSINSYQSMVKKRAFTFIEMLVVVAVIGFALPALFAMLYVILQQQVKVYRIAEVKRQGDYIVTFLQNNIKNYGFIINGSSGQICSAVTASPTAITSFNDKYGNTLAVSFVGGSVNFTVTNLGGTVPQIPLTSGSLTNAKVQVTGIGDNMKCTKSSQYSAAIVSISFAISYITAGTRPEEQAALTYQNYIKLRNF